MKLAAIEGGQNVVGYLLAAAAGIDEDGSAEGALPR